MDKLPDILSRNIGRLPDRQPEELNLLMIAHKFAELEKAKNVHSEVLTTLKIDMLNLQDGTDNGAKYYLVNHTAKFSKWSYI